MKIVKVIGPPGTGKTTWARRKVIERVEAGVPLHRIGYLSFTKGAAEVIRERMKASEQDVRWFRTIHSACMSLLGIGRDSVITSVDYRAFRDLTGMDVRSDEFDDWAEDKPLDFTPTKRAMELAAATQTSIYDVIRDMPAHVNLTRGRVDLFIERWEEFKRTNHKFDFTDMLTKFIETPTAMPVDELFLDEAQDLSVLQWKVFHELAKDAKIVYIIGDDDQAIYPFIGGSEYGFLDHPCDEEIILSKSYRCPKGVGEAADHIIQRVAHRKEKHVEWRDDTGGVDRLNLDAFNLPWRKWLDEYKTIMVLCRHRAGARNFSDDLKLVGIPHELNGEGLASWKEAKLALTFMKLAGNNKVTVRAARDLCAVLNVDDSNLFGLGPRSLVTRKQLRNIDYDANWVVALSGGNSKRLRRLEAIRQLVNHEGLASLEKKPQIRVGTMHSAKGDEAELIVIVPECTSIVRKNMMTAGEIRLAYVTMTRAQKQVVVLIPRSDSYITHFFGGW